MSIQRATHNQQHPYFMIVRGVAQNKAISYEALGLLTYLLSKPDDWKIVPEDLKRVGCGRDKVYKLLKELEAAGHIIQKRQEAAQGVPPMWGERTVVEQPYPEKPDTEIQDMVKNSPETPDTVNAGYGETDTTYTDKYINTDQKQERGRARDPRAVALLNAYLGATLERYRPSGLLDSERAYQQAKRLVDIGCTADDATSLIREKRAEGKINYPFSWLVADLPQYSTQRSQPLGDPTDRASVAYAWASAQ